MDWVSARISQMLKQRRKRGNQNDDSLSGLRLRDPLAVGDRVLRAVPPEVSSLVVHQPDSVSVDEAARIQCDLLSITWTGEFFMNNKT
jgi:hypothetical protein